MNAASRLTERLVDFGVERQVEGCRHALQAGLREESVCLRAASPADRVLQEPMRQDDVRSREVLAPLVSLDDKAAVVSNKLEAERADRGARLAAAGRRARHIKQTVREVEVAGFYKLDEPLTVSKRCTVRVAEDRVAFELDEPHGRSEPLADQRGQFTNDLMRVLELGAGEKLRVAGDVSEEEVAFSDSLFVQCRGLTHLVPSACPQ